MNVMQKNFTVFIFSDQQSVKAQVLVAPVVEIPVLEAPVPAAHCTSAESNLPLALVLVEHYL